VKAGVIALLKITREPLSPKARPVINRRGYGRRSVEISVYEAALKLEEVVVDLNTTITSRVVPRENLVPKDGIF